MRTINKPNFYVCPECGKGEFYRSVTYTVYGTSYISGVTGEYEYNIDDETVDDSDDYEVESVFKCKNCDKGHEFKELITEKEWENKEKLKILDEAIKE